MNHIDYHTLELYALESEELELSMRQIERHLAECSGCRDLYGEIKEYYERAAASIQEAPGGIESAGEAIARRMERAPVPLEPAETGYLGWTPNALGRLYLSLRNHPAMAGTGALVLGAMAWALFSIVPRLVNDSNPAYASLNPGSSKLEAYNRSNELLWSVPVTGIENARTTESRDHLPSVVVTDMDGDGRNEVVTTLKSVAGSGTMEGAMLAVLGEDGKILWQDRAERTVQFRGVTYPSAWLQCGILVADFDGDDRKEIVCRAMTGRSPCVILRFGADGHVLGEYWHFGHLPKVAAFDFARSGKTRLLLAGCNDADGNGDFGFIDITFINPGRLLGKTEAVTTPGFGYPPFDAAWGCVRLPNTSLNTRYHSKPGVDAVVVDSSAHPPTVSVWWAASLPANKIVLEYVFGGDLVLRELRSSDATIRFLTELRQRGEISSHEVEDFLPALRAGVEYWDGKTWSKAPHLFSDSWPPNR